MCYHYFYIPYFYKYSINFYYNIQHKNHLILPSLLQLTKGWTPTSRVSHLRFDRAMKGWSKSQWLKQTKEIGFELITSQPHGMQPLKSYSQSLKLSVWPYYNLLYINYVLKWSIMPSNSLSWNGHWVCWWVKDLGVDWACQKLVISSGPVPKTIVGYNSNTQDYSGL